MARHPVGTFAANQRAPRRGTPLPRRCPDSPSHTAPNRVGDEAELRRRVAEDDRRQHLAAQMEVGDVLPRLPDAAVHLHHGLADVTRATSAA